MQNLGLAYAVYPALELPLPGPGGAAAAVQRHLTLFNTHPYVAAAIVGGVLFHEERIARGEEDPERVEEFKRRPDGSPGRAGRRLLLALAQARGGRPVRGARAAGWGPGRRSSSWSCTTSCTSRCARSSSGWALHAGGPLVEAVARARLPRRGRSAPGGGRGERGCGGAWLAFAFGTQQGGWAGLAPGAGLSRPGGAQLRSGGQEGVPPCAVRLGGAAGRRASGALLVGCVGER